MRILHAPANPADQAGVVVRALRALGHDAELWVYGPSRFGYPADRTIDIEVKDNRVLWDAFVEAIERFDVFHFHYGRSFFPYGWDGFPPYWDLPLLRMLGKKIFFTFVGNDVRMRRVLDEHNPYSALHFAQFTSDDDAIAKKINVIRTYAHRMFVLSGELALYVPDADLMPRAFGLHDWPELPPSTRDVPVVLHAPSRRAIKGTEQILAGLDQLRADGVVFELRIIEDAPHDEIKRAIGDADVVIDQVLSGDHGIISVEAMASGRVAVAYLLEEVKRGSPALPIYDASPDTFVERMRLLLTDASLRRDLGARGRPYVAENFDALVVARAHVTAYEQPAPARATRTFPDWVTYGEQRRTEGLEQKVADLTVERARLLARNELLTQRVKEQALLRATDAQRTPKGQRTPKDMVARQIRSAIRRFRTGARPRE